MWRFGVRRSTHFPSIFLKETSSKDFPYLLVGFFSQTVSVIHELVNNDNNNTMVRGRDSIGGKHGTTLGMEGSPVGQG